MGAPSGAAADASGGSLVVGDASSGNADAASTTPIGKDGGIATQDAGTAASDSSGATPPVTDAAVLDSGTGALCGANATNHCGSLVCSAALGCVECVSDADCPGTAPRCFVRTGSCVQCLSNAGCPSSAPVCAPGLLSCVQCLSDADCPASAPNCKSGRCEM